MLTPKQARFVAEYRIDLNATQAAIRAGYSVKTAKAQGSRLLTNADVKAAVEVKNSKSLEKLELTAIRVDEHIAEMAFARVGQEFENGVTMKAADKIAGLALASKRLGLLKEKVEHDVGPNIVDLINAAARGKVE